jgi:hypothetical protein
LGVPELELKWNPSDFKVAVEEGERGTTWLKMFFTPDTERLDEMKNGYCLFYV